MVYNKLMKVCISIALIMLVVSNVLFATTALGNTDDEVYSGIMKALLRIQKYSWPVAVIIFIYAIYQRSLSIKYQGKDLYLDYLYLWQYYNHCH